MAWLIEIGHKEGIRKLTAAMFNSNTPMVGLARRFGFQFTLEEDIVTATREI